MAIGRVGLEENKRHSHAVMTALETIGVPPNKVYITFQDAALHDFGLNKTTLDNPIFKPLLDS